MCETHIFHNSKQSPLPRLSFPDPALADVLVEVDLEEIL